MKWAVTVGCELVTDFNKMLREKKGQVHFYTKILQASSPFTFARRRRRVCRLLRDNFSKRLDCMRGAILDHPRLVVECLILKINARVKILVKCKRLNETTSPRNIGIFDVRR